MLRVSCIIILLIGVHQNTNAKQCSSPGKFPQDQVGDCSGYALCLMAGVGSYAQYNMTCPPGFIYNHLLSRCTNETSYHCEPDFNCTEPGQFPSPFSDNCTAYIACVEGMNDIMTARSIECPSGFIFNSDSQYFQLVRTCVESNDIAYDCPTKPQNRETSFSVLPTNQTLEESNNVTVHSIDSTNNVGDLTAFHVSVFLIICILHRLF